LEHLGTTPTLLPAGLQDADQDALGSRASRGAIPAPHFARHHHGPDGLFRSPVGRIQTWAMPKAEQRILFPPQMVGETLVLRTTIVGLQEAIHPGFQPASGCGQTARADLLLSVAIRASASFVRESIAPARRSG
jgi:hypothetical protein